MSKPFVGRTRELGILEKAWKARSSALIPVYGRRRVGKSELILHFAREKPCIYLAGKQVPAEWHRTEFLQTAAEQLEEPLLAQFGARDWREAFQTAVARWPGRGKLIIALDEFQWMVETSPELPSVIQELWDREWSRSGKIFLILCGSLIGFMEREVLGEKSPLFGRRSAQILLRPFSFREAAEFHPRYSVEDAARVYFVCGGVAQYHEAFDPSCSVAQNIGNQLFDEFAPLFREPDFLLKEELRGLGIYHAVLTALAQGKATHQELAAAAGLSPPKLPYYLNQLMELGYVERRYPLAAGKPNPRAIRYLLRDPLLRFWFRFVFPNLSRIRSLPAERAFDQVVAPQWESYQGSCFERLCREALGLLYREERVQAAFEIGEYWDKEVQIDVVGLRQDGWIDLGECKWGTVRSPKAVIGELERKVQSYSNPDAATLQRRIFTRRKLGLPKGETRIKAHDLAELYQLS